MSFFIFGPYADSWAIGNHLWTAHQNLPRTYSNYFDDQALTAFGIKWFSTGPGGLYCFLKSDNSFLQSQNADLLADTKVSNVYGISIQDIDHLSFSTGGGWFIRYTDGTVQLSTVGTFPQNFYNIANEYMQTSGVGARHRQQSRLQYVFFGADGAVLVKLTNGSLKWAGLPDSLADCIRQNLAEGWSLAKQSSLCQWDKSYYYLNWTQPSGNRTSTSYNVKLTGILTPLLLREVAEGKVPVSATALTPVPLRAIPETSRLTAQPAKEYIGFALWPFSSFESGELSFEKWEDITHICRKNDEWYFGRNSKGESGEFPRQFVSLWTDPFISDVRCDVCGKDVNGIYYHCSLCHGGDFDICQKCEEDPSHFGQCYDNMHQTTLNFQLKEAGASLTCADTRWQDSVNDGILELFSSYDGHLNGVELPDVSLLNIGAENMKNESPRLQSTPKSTVSEDEPKDKNQVKEDKYEKQLSNALDSAIVTESPNVHWDDIAGLHQAKEELQEALILPIKLPHLFTGKRKARRGILLYGPPGTGKSFLAKACATEIKCTFFSISCSDIMSKWIGESERLVKQVFKKARENKPSIIFIDEIDSMGGTRDSEEKYVSGMKTEFLVQMDGVGNDSDGVLVLAATNLPWKLDPALRRRFQRRIHIGLPDAKARARMFEIGIGDTACKLTSEDYENLGVLTESFSGSDIHIAVQDALMVPVKKISSATHFRKITQNQGERFMPCAASEIAAFPMKWTMVSAEKLLEPPLTADDFFMAISKSKPSVSPDEMLRYGKWTEEYGSEGS